ncbi:MAG TPA: isoprenylcysteine carboxylmethyltransferase family protein [Acidobacteriaceae bacterium]|jgi:protein-S-isoprenylcysteine O-methyltransferase Ste14|nr:isoprenylcysteine carboxylmethyltransferase family protein [Acidobacteriaceae bacterium]
MQAFYQWFFPAVWIAFLLYWQISALGAKTTTRLESAASRITRTVVFFVAIALFFLQHIPIPWLYWHFLPTGLPAFYIGAAITVAGLLFAVWARITIGANWSRSVTIKQNHELVTSGPYALVRHPIYTGLLTALLGSAIALAQFRGLIAFALFFISLWYKLRLEENWMRSQFGDTYTTYAQRTAALVPWLL